MTLNTVKLAEISSANLVQTLALFVTRNHARPRTGKYRTIHPTVQSQTGDGDYQTTWILHPPHGLGYGDQKEATPSLTTDTLQVFSHGEKTNNPTSYQDQTVRTTMPVSTVVMPPY